MTIRSKTDQPGEPVPAHSDEVFEVHERMLGASPARSRHIEVRSGRRVHVIEAGEGPPVLFLHGGSTSSLSLLPLLDRLKGVRAFAVGPIDGDDSQIVDHLHQDGDVSWPLHDLIVVVVETRHHGRPGGGPDDAALGQGAVFRTLRKSAKSTRRPSRLSTLRASRDVAVGRIDNQRRPQGLNDSCSAVVPGVVISAVEVGLRSAVPPIGDLHPHQELPEARTLLSWAEDPGRCLNTTGNRRGHSRQCQDAGTDRERADEHDRHPELERDDLRGRRSRAGDVVLRGHGREQHGRREHVLERR